MSDARELPPQRAGGEANREYRGGTFLGWPGRAGDRAADQPTFPQAARDALDDTQQRRNLQQATATIRGKRADAVAELADWEQLREAGRAIKERTLRHLDHYLVQLERAVAAAGGTVHWARDAAEANRIVTDLVSATGEREVVKVKSMVTQEIDLNEALARAGISVHETDLAELIVQLGDDWPSHILVPAIHRNRAEIRDIFARAMDDAPADLTADPRALAEAARAHLRERFLTARVGICGANFMIAENGAVVVAESEGNGRMCVTLPETLVAVAGIEKVLPTFADLEVFLQLLPRSSTGERMNPYTSTWTGTTPGDGPQDFHLVLLDGGRTDTLADTVGRQALNCIRCSACLNACPVYERTGGHAYGSIYPGPIGAILTPQLGGLDSELDRSLPYASSLCGACYEVCPVKINIPEVLVHLRGRVVDVERGRRVPKTEALSMRAAQWALSEPAHLAAAQRVGTAGGRLLGKISGRRDSIGRLPGPFAAWTDARDLPAPPRETFRQWWKRTRS